MSQYDMFESKSARDAALNQVEENAGNFTVAALDAIASIPSGSIMTGEDIRRAVSNAGIRPHHHNAWGALINIGIKRKLIEPTGDYVHMSDIKSHARRTPVYRRR